MPMVMGPLEEAAHADKGEGCNGHNYAAFDCGQLKHEPPIFEYFDPVGTEQQSLWMKEVKLPRAKQTHEVCYEPVTRCVFVSQMSNSVLVRIPIDADGFLMDDHDAWMVGEKNEATGKGICGMHNISLSAAHPGCLWISMQYANRVMLVDVRPKRALRVLQLIEMPTVFVDADMSYNVGGPHCMRECPVTGDIWVGLKGALKDAPCSRKASARKSSCCDPEAQEAAMKELEARGMQTPKPDGWAVWRLSPSEYDPLAPNKGGVLYPCFKSPPMLCFDTRGNAYVPQDGVDTMLYVERETGRCEQLAVPFPAGEPPRGGSIPRITGPAIAMAPDGSIWMTLLGSYCALVRIDPDDGNKRVLYEFGGPPWVSKLRLIHLDFSAADPHGGDTYNRIYAIASDLLDDEAINAVVELKMDSDWRTCIGRRVIPLPTQDCACHRIAFVDAKIDDRPQCSRSVVITELASSKVLQIKVRHLLDYEVMDEEVHTDDDGFEVRRYKATDEEWGRVC